jgi:DNA-directed RNA polymerase subunit L
MTIRVIKEAGNRLEIEILNEDHTMGNLLRTTLLKDDTVKYAGYQIIHPLTGGIRLVVETKEGQPRQALLRAISKIDAETNEFKEKFKKVI